MQRGRALPEIAQPQARISRWATRVRQRLTPPRMDRGRVQRPDQTQSAQQDHDDHEQDRRDALPKATGLRSISGCRVLLENAFLGCAARARAKRGTRAVSSCSLATSDARSPSAQAASRIRPRAADGATEPAHDGAAFFIARICSLAVSASAPNVDSRGWLVLSSLSWSWSKFAF